MPLKYKEENVFESNFSEFQAIDAGAMAVSHGEADISLPMDQADQMDTLLAVIKWTFVFIPGAAGIHCMVLISSLWFAMGAWPNDLLLQAIGSLLIFSFLVLFGLGRLGELRYFKVIAAILSSAILSSVIVHTLASFFVGYSNFGWGMLLTLPLTVWFAHTIKRRIDENESV